jgi:hypothetical protein
MPAESERYYIRKQTNAGPNQGKWRVHRPDGVSVSPACDTRVQAAHICAAFELARQHPIDGSRIGIERNFAAGSEQQSGKHYINVPSRGWKRVGDS